MIYRFFFMEHYETETSSRATLSGLSCLHWLGPAVVLVEYKKGMGRGKHRVIGFFGCHMLGSIG